MEGSVRHRPGLPLSVVGCIALGLVLAHWYRLAFRDGTTIVTVLVRDIGPLLASIMALAGVYWLVAQKLDVAAQRRILLWVLGGIGAVGGIGFLTSLVQQPGAILSVPSYVVVNVATGGLVIGLLVGVYDARSEQRDRALLALHETAQNLLEAQSKVQACRISVDAANSVVHLPLTAIWLVEEDRLEPVAMSDDAADVFETQPVLTADDSLAWSVYDHQEPSLFDDVSGQDDVHNPQTAVTSEYIVPLGEHGVMISGRSAPVGFSSLQLELVELIAAYTELVLDRIDRTHRLQANERELEQQNERLEQFASVVSHDLRNHLNVIDGYLSLARQTRSAADFDETSRAVDRMNTLVDDLLALARSGEPIDDPEPVSLQRVVENASGSVDVAGIDVLTDDDLGVVLADGSRLKQLFENLFTNVAEHAEDAETIRVESIDQGFAVEDDGPGIPEQKRETVFEYGYTSSQSGTGLGLSIVHDIVQGHGWSISVGTGADGGARFEIRGVARAESAP
ncbi:ATP-binding protein [Halobacteria archaeon AArc-dxtr1]|nr:ATP-binding protein [Halobacteria archaeon AArc-dxtr1]